MEFIQHEQKLCFSWAGPSGPRLVDGPETQARLSDFILNVVYSYLYMYIKKKYQVVKT